MHLHYNEIINLIIIGIITYFIFSLYLSIQTIKSIESKNNSKIIFIRNFNHTLINKFYYNILNYFLNIVISIDDDIAIKNIFNSNSNMNIDIIIESIGGLISSNDRILNTMENFNNQINVYIFNYAWSAATMIALASDNIYMNDYATFGPTDPQICIMNEMVSLQSINKLVKNKSIDKIADIILINYYDSKCLYDMNYKQISKFIKKHAKNNVSQKKINKLINFFALGNIPHDSTITYDMLKEIININIQIPSDIKKIYNIVNKYFYLLN